MRNRVQPHQIILRSIFSASGIWLITIFASNVMHINASTVGFSYLLIVLLIASNWGFIEGAVASIAATLAFNYYFLPPVGTFTIADPHNWVALFSFLACSLIASRLSAKAERRALDAIERQNDIERLYYFSRSILLQDEIEPIPKQLVNKLAESFQLTAVVLFERRSGSFFYAGPSDLKGVEGQLRESALRGAFFSDPENQISISSIRLGSEPIASLALQGTPVSDSLLQNIANLIAISLERDRIQELASRAEAARQTEQLRITLIDAMAHEFKTPLTSIKAATTALLSTPDLFSESNLEMIQIADEEADRVKELVDETVEMSRLEMDRVSMELESSNICELIQELTHSMQRTIEDRPIKLDCPQEIPLISVDHRLMKLAIRQLLDNALKYSPPRTPIRIRVQQMENEMTVGVSNTGEGISEKEQPHLFERYYRGPSVRQQIPGLGLGLSIVKRIATLHNGGVTVVSHPGNTTFQITLPLGNKGQRL